MKKRIALLGATLMLLTSPTWAGGMMPSGGMGTTMMSGGGMGSGGMMTGDTMTHLMMQDLGNRQMMGQGMQIQGMGMRGMENMQQNQVQEKIKDSMENSVSSSSRGMPGGMRSMEDFHLNQAAQCDKSAEVAQAMMTYGEQMKASYQTMMGQTSDNNRLETYKNMMEQYSKMTVEASKLKMDYKKMAQWHRSQAGKGSWSGREQDAIAGNVETIRSMMTYYEQMKTNDQKMMDQMPKDSLPETMKGMARHYDTMISNASKLKKHYEEMSKWHEVEGKHPGGAGKEPIKEENK